MGWTRDQYLNNEIRKYLGADDLKNWNGKEINTDYLYQWFYNLKAAHEAYWSTQNISGNTYARPEFLYINQNTSGLTIGKLVERLLNKSFKEKEIFWVGLRDLDIYCYYPCPESELCCGLNANEFTASIVTGEVIEQPPNTSIEKYSFFRWENGPLFLQEIFNDTAIFYIQDYIKEPEEFLNCGAIEIMKTEELDFFRENCKVKHRPLCMRWTPNSQFSVNPQKTMSDKKKKTRKNKKKNRKRGKKSSRQQGRQLTDTGRPIEMSTLR